MGQIDNIMYRYMSSKERFADLFNGVLFQGRNVILPEQLSEAAGKYTTVSQKPSKRSHTRCLSDRNRDIKMLLQSGGILRILTVENQSHIDYSMPLRCMEYDVLEYRKQVDTLKTANWAHKDFATQDEFLCGLKSGDRLAPVYTICLYHGETGWNGPLTLADMMDFQNDTNLFRPLFADYPFRLFCINAQPDFETFHSELKIFFMALNQRCNPRGLQQLMTENDACKHLSPDTTETLSILLDMPQIWEKREEYINLNREDYNMCYAVQRWHEEDISKGISIGKREGISIGREDKTRQIVINMLKRGFSDEDVSILTECSQTMIEEIKTKLIQK